ncbi:MAG: hypothetical protein E6Q73_09065, partial [Pseudorhodobacter sp.]
GAGNVLNAVLSLPVIGGNSLSTSYIGTFIVSDSTAFSTLPAPMPSAAQVTMPSRARISFQA